MQIRFKIVRHPCCSPRNLIKTILKTVRQPQSPVLRKSLQNSDAYILVQQQVLEDLSAKQEKVNKLAKHLASIMGTQDIVS